MLRITYLKLINMATIFTGMKQKMIEIDLSKSKNRVILFIGENGSGKTSILRELHPFPQTSDVRGNVVLEGEDGYKEIRYTKDKDKYVIKHYYPNGGNTKSFIIKNGAELNPNGNKSSFMELVEGELGIEPSHMDLLRLGSNVHGFIDKKSTERKNYASDLMKDLMVYSKLYKKINEDSRMMKTLLKSTGDKIDKLKIYSENEEKEKLANLENKLQQLSEQWDRLVSETGSVNGTVQTLVPQGMEQFRSDIRQFKHDIQRLTNQINNLIAKKSKLPVVILNDIQDAIAEHKEEVRTLEGKITVNQNMLDFYFKTLDQMYQQREEKANSLKYISSDVEYSQISELYVQLKKDKEELSGRFKDFVPKYTSKDLQSAIAVLQDIERYVSTIHEYSPSTVRKVANMYLQKESVDQYVREQVRRVDDEARLINQKIHQHRQGRTTLVDPDVMYVMYKPKDCNCACPFERFYRDVTGEQKQEDVASLEKELTSIEYQRETYLSHQDVAKTIDYILMIIRTNQTIIQRTGIEAFQIEHILESIRDDRLIYNEDELTNLVVVLEDYERLQGLDAKIHEVKREMKFIEVQKNSTNIGTTQQELLELDKTILQQESEIERLRKENDAHQTMITNITETLQSFEEYKVLQEEIEQLQQELDTTSRSFNEANELYEKVESLVQTLQVIQQKMNILSKEIKETENGISDIRFKLREFKALHEERAILEEKFDDVSIIREALSASKGIPLLYMQLFLNDTKADVNNFLHTVYKGNLEIDDFVINEKEFRIPYTKNGITVEDAAMCSQGERTFISLAMSFGLILHSIDEYNIMTLDEIDATLDAESRAVFISLIEKQLEAIGAGQVFIITHNNMFDNYPVDVIMTSDVKIDNYKNTNIIWRAA